MSHKEMWFESILESRNLQNWVAYSPQYGLPTLNVFVDVSIWDVNHLGCFLLQMPTQYCPSIWFRLVLRGLLFVYIIVMMLLDVFNNWN